MPSKPNSCAFEGDLFGLGKGAMIAPEVILVQRFQASPDRESRWSRSLSSAMAADGAAIDARVWSASRVAPASAAIWSAWDWVAKLGSRAAGAEDKRRCGSDRSLSLSTRVTRTLSVRSHPGNDCHENLPLSKRFQHATQTYTIPGSGVRVREQGTGNREQGIASPPALPGPQRMKLGAPSIGRLCFCPMVGVRRTP